MADVPAVVCTKQNVEVIIITGLPGSGRSALLASLMRSLPSDSRCAVCVHLHAKAFGLETAALPVAEPKCVHFSEVFDFGSGCLCCSPDGDLNRLLLDLSLRQEKLALTHMLIETTGVADPCPFIKLFASETSMFKLLGVVCVVDMLLARTMLEGTRQEFANRGTAQLHAADVLVLNRLDELQARGPDVNDEIALVSDFASSLAVSASDQATTARAMPAVLGPYTYCSLEYRDLCDVLAQTRLKRHCSAPAQARSSTPAPTMLNFGIGSGHDAALETACIVIPRGGVCLDAALGILEASLRWWGVVRVQGYLSFLPREKEGVTSREFPPPLERSWAMPMVVVEGTPCQLKIQAVNMVTAPFAAATCAEAAGRPWQDTAMEAAAADRGGCKIFICGHGLEEQELRHQLCQTAAKNFQGPVCDLEYLDELAPFALQARDKIDNAIMSMIEAGLGDNLSCVASNSQGAHSAERERASAEEFGQHLDATLRATIAPDVLASGHIDSRHAAFHLPVGHDLGEQSMTLRWADGSIYLNQAHDEAVLVSAAPSDAGKSKLAARDVQLAAKDADISEFDVLVVGTKVFGRPKK